MWQDIKKTLIPCEEITNDFPSSGQITYNILCEALQSLNLTFVKRSEIIDSETYHGTAIFYGVSKVDESNYAVGLEIIGLGHTCRIIVTSYAPDERCLLGFHHKVLDTIQNRIKIKEAMNLTQIFISGDYVSGPKITDSIVYRSAINK